MASLEQERLKNIAANQALLRDLQLKAGDGSAIPQMKSAPRVKASKPRAKPAPKPPIDSDAPRRRSSRHSTVLASDPAQKEAIEKRRREEEEEQAELLRAAKRARHEDRAVAAIYPTGAQWKSEHEEALNQNALSGLLKDLAGLPIPNHTRQTDASLQKGKDKKIDHAMQDLKDTMSHLSLSRVERVVPERIYSMAVHPDATQEIVFVGDKSGHLGILNASAPIKEAEDDDDEEETVAGHAFAFKAHAKSAISCIRLAPHQAHTIYTSGYDCTLRALNFETGSTTEIVDADALAAEEYGEDEALLSGFDLTSDGHGLWISDNRGGVLHRDLRAAKSTTRRWQVSENKIGCISVNPVDDTVFVTAHLNRAMRIYDARKLSDSKTSLTYQDHYDACCVTEYMHDKACSSAYFDWQGKRILSTSYDNTLRIYHVDPNKIRNLPDAIEADHVVQHDNQVGRYVSVFKAQWSNNPNAPSHFTVGNMRRGLDVYGGDGTQLVSLYDPEITAIPAVTATHPNITARAYGGNGSGKVSVWVPGEPSE